MLFIIAAHIIASQLHAEYTVLSTTDSQPYTSASALHSLCLHFGLRCAQRWPLLAEQLFQT